MGQKDDDDQWSPFIEADADEEVKVPQVIGPMVPEPDLLDRIWSWPRIIDNPENRFIQQLRIVGRYHGQYGAVSTSQGTFDGYENRRERIGLVVDFLNQFRFRAQARGEKQDVFDKSSLEDAWFGWRPKFLPGLSIKAGQFKPVWSYEWALSSNTMPIIERSQFVNQFRPDRSTGISAYFEKDRWSLGLSAFSGNLHEGLLNDEGGFGILNLGYDFAEMSDVWDELDWRFDYLYNADSEQINMNQAYRHAYSMSLEGKRDNIGLAVDLMYINGLGDAGSALGASVIPSYELIPNKLSLVGRYHYANSHTADRLSLQSRYESKVPALGDMKGKNYHSAYAGINWFLHKKILFMNGVEYSNMRGGGSNGGDFDGWTFFSGIRIWF